MFSEYLHALMDKDSNLELWTSRFERAQTAFPAFSLSYSHASHSLRGRRGSGFVSFISNMTFSGNSQIQGNFIIYWEYKYANFLRTQPGS